MEPIPNDETGEALREILKNGSDLTRPMEIDFFVAVPSKKTGNQVALKAKALGFKISVEQDDETGDWTCYCTKTLIPEYSKVVKIEKQLSSISKVYGGYSDGFGSYGNVKTH
jgi:regulator of RNase E activity RraB